MTLTREQILGADDRKNETVDVPEWGGAVKVRSMSGAEAEKYTEIVSEEGRSGVANLALLVSMCVVDEDNKPLFSDEDIKALAEKDINVLNAVATACMKVNGFEHEKVAAGLKETASE